MTIDVFSATGTKKGTMELPKDLFEATVNRGLIHQAVMMQQSNRRSPIAHAKSRSEVAGSTRKLYAQKHTGQARRGSVRSPLLRGGGKAFGPKKDRNFTKDMPRAMRHAALAACLSAQARNKVIIGLENYPEKVKTKDLAALLTKLPVELGRNILFVLPEAHRALTLSCRNLPKVKTLLAAYLNPEDVTMARHIIFLNGSIEKAQEIFTKRSTRVKAVPAERASAEKPAKKVAAKPVAKKAAAAPKKKTTKKASSPAA